MSFFSTDSKRLLSRRVLSIKESPTLAVTEKASRKKAAGEDIVALAAGEPNFDTPSHIKSAAILAIQAGKTKYTPVSGTADLKRAVVQKFYTENGTNYLPEQILVSCGVKHGLFNLCQALLQPGDEVIIPAPYWVSYPDMVLLAEASPVFISCGIEQGFKLTAKQLEGAITPNTRLLILNSPSNPTGVVYSKDELAAFGAVLKRYPHTWIASDDIYEHLLFGDKKPPFFNILNACPELYERTVLFNGVSKAYAMTGWRIGYAAGPVEVIDGMAKVQSQSTSNPCSISQAAATAALDPSQQGCIEPMRRAFSARHDYTLARLKAIPTLQSIAADSAFYSFVNATSAIERLFANKKIAEKNDLALANYLLDHHRVAVVPGSAFGMEGYFRVSFATSEESLKKAFDRIEAALA